MTTVQLLDHAQHVHASGAHQAATEHLAASFQDFWNSTKGVLKKALIFFVIFLVIIFLIGFIIGFWLGRKLGKHSGRKEAERGMNALTDND